MSAARPAVNIIEPQTKNVYFGFSLFPPSTTFPYREAAIKIENKNIPNPINR